MMKKIGLLGCVLLLFAACNDDKDFFETPVPEESISFEPVSGGAVMRYKLPENTDISAVKVCYANERNEEVTILGSVYSDSVVLTGFNAPRKDVPVSISVTDNNGVESKRVEYTFSTLASAPYAFIDSVEVHPTWGGLNIHSKYSGSVSGLVDVYQVGINKHTQKPDTLYIKNFMIQAGSVKSFVELNVEGETSIVLKSEDGKGNYVRTKVIPGMKVHPIEQYSREKLTVSDPGKFSLEIPEGPNYDNDWGYLLGAFGIEYLIDGDVTGKKRLEGDNGNYYTYATKGENLENTYVQLELKEARVIAKVRLYCMIKNRSLYYEGPIQGSYTDRLPCKVKILASNDEEAARDAEVGLDSDKWVELAHFEQNPNGKSGYWPEHPLIDTERPGDYDNLEPCYAEIVCDVVPTGYKYLRVVSMDHFDMAYSEYSKNYEDYISYHELEVYVQKD